MNGYGVSMPCDSFQNCIDQGAKIIERKNKIEWLEGKEETVEDPIYHTWFHSDCSAISNLDILSRDLIDRPTKIYSIHPHINPYWNGLQTCLCVKEEQQSKLHSYKRNLHQNFLERSRFFPYPVQWTVTDCPAEGLEAFPAFRTSLVTPMMNQFCILFLDWLGVATNYVCGMWLFVVQKESDRFCFALFSHRSFSRSFCPWKSHPVTSTT